MKLKQEIENCKNNCEAIDFIIDAQGWNREKQAGKVFVGKYSKALTRALLEFEKPALNEIKEHIVDKHLRSRPDLVSQVRQAHTLAALRSILDKENCNGGRRFVDTIMKADKKKNRGSTLHFGSRAENNSSRKP